MSFTHKVKEENQTNPIIPLLNLLLANTIDFKLASKQAHWNVKGKNFIALHELFDKVSSEIDGYADMLAERVVQLNGTALGTLQTVSSRSVMVGYPVNIHDGQEHVRALTGVISLLADTHRQAINTATAAGDMVTADLCTQVTRGLDKLHWLIRSHMNG